MRWIEITVAMVLALAATMCPEGLLMIDLDIFLVTNKYMHTTTHHQRVISMDHDRLVVNQVFERNL